MKLPIDVEVNSRDSFMHLVHVNEPGKTIQWSFQTKKRSIGFGLFLKPLSSSSYMDIQQYDSLQEASTRPPSAAIPSAATGDGLVTASVGRKLLNMTLPRSRSTSVGVSPTVVDPLHVFHSPTSSGFPFSRRSGRNTFSFQSRPVSSVSETFPDALNVSDTESADVYEIVLPVHRFKADSFAVKGSHVAQRADKTTAAAAKPKEPEVSGWMLKRKRKKNQGWIRRWVHLQHGIISYYARPNGACRGSISAFSAAISVIADQRLIVVDSGTLLYFFKCLSSEELGEWVEALRYYRTNFAERMSARQRQSMAEGLNVDVGGGVGYGEVKEIQSKLVDAEMQLSRLKESPQLTDTTLPLTVQLQAVHGLLSDCLDRLQSINLGKMNSLASPLAISSSSLLNRKGHLSTSKEFLSNLHERRSSSIPETQSIGSDVFFDAQDIVLNSSDAEDESDGAESVSSSDHVRSQPQDTEHVSSESESDDEPQPSSFASAKMLSPIQSTRLVDQVPSLSSRRQQLPRDMISEQVSILSILRKNVGKDLSSVAMPVSLNEPLSALQRLCEELDYAAELLKTANQCATSLDRLKWVAAFAVSGYSFMGPRSSRKPFNPLLGETYEWTSEDNSIRFISEKVDHHPHVLACHAESPDFEFEQYGCTKSKFWGKSIELTPVGKLYLTLKSHSETYTWNKVNTHISVIGGASLEYFGDLRIESSTGEQAVITFKQAGYFSSQRHQVEGAIYDRSGSEVLKLTGTWSESLAAQIDLNTFEILWRARPLPVHSALQYGFTQFTMQLNEVVPGVHDGLPETDSRYRPDQCLLEQGDVETAEQEKLRIEQAQRDRRRALQREGQLWAPRFFDRVELESGEIGYRYRKDYWDQRRKGVFERELKLW